MNENEIKNDDTLEAIPCNEDSNICSYIVFEGNITRILLRAKDTSELKRILYFQIISVPKYGTLHEENSSKTISPGYRLTEIETYPYEKGVTILFHPSPNYFTSPSFHVNASRDSFQFAVVAAIDGFLGMAASPPTIQEIEVVNINDPTSISIPTQLRKVYPFSSLQLDDKRCPSLNDEMNCSRKLEISDIIVSDPDMNVDFVRVDVKSSKGFIKLNSLYLNMTDFVGCSSRNEEYSYNQTDWNCKGSGTGDQEMTFLTRPLDLNYILNGMIFESFSEGIDYIDISIHDGVGGNCLSRSEIEHINRISPLHGHKTFYENKCFSVTRSIPIEVVTPKYPSNTRFYWRIPFHLLVSVSIGLLVLIIIITVQIRKRRQARNAKDKIQITEQNNNPIPNSHKVKKKRHKKRKSKTKHPSTGKQLEGNNKSSADNICVVENQDQSTPSSLPSKDYDVKEENNQYSRRTTLDIIRDLGTNEQSTLLKEISHDHHGKKELLNQIRNRSSNVVDTILSENHDIDTSNYENESELSEEESSSHGWIQHLDHTTSRHYYENTKTRKVTWTEPPSFVLYENWEEEEMSSQEKHDYNNNEDATSLEENDEPIPNSENESEHSEEESILPEWIQHLDHSSSQYYYENTKTRKITWTKPPSFLEYEDLEEDESVDVS